MMPEHEANETAAAGAAEQQAKVKLLMRKKTTALAAFTRHFNILSKSLEEKREVDCLQTMFQELEERYKQLEVTCNDIFYECEDDGGFNDLAKVLDEKLSMLQDIRIQIASCNVTAVKTQNDSTSELVKSFKASLTLPKPQFHKFDGNPSSFSSFLAHIETYVESTIDDNRQLLSILIDSCSGIAYEAIAFLSQCHDPKLAYTKAKTILRDLFGGKHQIIQAVMSECAYGPVIKPNDVDSLRKLVIAMKKAEVTLTECDAASELTSTDKLVKIYGRLPKVLQYKWADKLSEMETSGRKPSFDTMCKLIEKFIKSKDNEYSNHYVQYQHESKPKSSTKPVFSVSDSSSSASNAKCQYCEKSHYLNKCPTFDALDVKKRYQFVSDKNLCRNCLHYGHVSSKCKRKGLCKHCNCKHNSILHDFDYKSSSNCQQDGSNSQQNCPNSQQDSDDSGSVSNKTSYACENKSVSQDAGLACVEVLVEGKDALYRCKAIVDRKSSVNLCTERLASKLQLPSVPFKTTFNVATGSSVVSGRTLKDVKVYSNDLCNNVMVNEVLTLKSIPISKESLFTQSDISGLSHLHKVSIPTFSSSDEIDLLIGSGVPKAFHQIDECKGTENEIYAVLQPLGWDLVGPKRNRGAVSGSFMCTSNPSVFFVDSLSTNIQFDISRVFDTDFKDCSLFSDELGPSQDDREACKLVEASTVLDNNKFSVGIPWKENPQNLPFNRVTVMKRMNSLKRRLLSDSQFHEEYTCEMNKLIENEFIEPCAPNFDASIPKVCHYIPLHPVWHPRKGTLRIVWDCAESLNDFIYEGPNVLNSLVDVLIRFRRFKYAITSDIRKMYLNVELPESDRDAFRILWWKDGDLSSEPSDYRSRVHIFGAKSSSFVVNNCVKKLAASAEGSIVRNALMNDLYVDDQASSVANEKDAVILATGMRSVLAKGGFHLTKFASNSPAVVNLIPKNDLIESVNFGDDLECSVLGIKWNVMNDEMSFRCSVPAIEQPPSRRIFLSLIAKIYDPLGMVSPVILLAKVLIQEKCSLGWDDCDEDMASRWRDLCHMIGMVSNLLIPRCYKPCDAYFDNPVDISLHGFCDASNVGYSAVVYIRQTASSGQVSVSFVFGKSRVAPKFKGKIQKATVPKLELNAAALLAKLVHKVKLCIDISFSSTYYWCDSQAVLSSIQSMAQRFPVYWSNRLAIIHGLSDVRQWRFVPTSCNPADVGSRGVNVECFEKKIQFWLCGPSFLLLSSDKWPETESPISSETIMVVNGRDQPTVQGSAILDRLIIYYSDLNKLLRVVYRLLYFMRVIKNDSVHDGMQKCELVLIRYVQRHLMVDNLKKLNPFKDDQGIYHANTRLSKANHLSNEIKFPIILPKSSPLTTLLIRDEHHRSAHMGTDYTLAKLRKRFWVIGGRSTVKSVISRCMKCKKESAAGLQQIMSPLPEERLKPTFPFQFVGLDFFGPFHCKVRRQSVKRYGCIFVCLSTRAIHIECVNSLESSSFISSLMRFIARRGQPDRIFSDNATNFRGSQVELKHVILSLNDSAMKFANQRGFNWHFHPPLGSHHGGHYERLIRSVRKVLRGITNEQNITEDNLTTFLCEAERILNDRPITAVNSDPESQLPLTPSLILLLRGNPCLSFDECDNLSRKCYRQAQYLANLFWTRWLKEYLPSLQIRQKWMTPKRDLKVNDLVLMTGEGYSRGYWPIARVTEVIKSSDGCIRKVVVKCKNGSKIRPITKLALLEASD